MAVWAYRRPTEARCVGSRPLPHTVTQGCSSAPVVETRWNIAVTERGTWYRNVPSPAASCCCPHLANHWPGLLSYPVATVEHVAGAGAHGR